MNSNCKHNLNKKLKYFKAENYNRSLDEQIQKALK